MIIDKEKLLKEVDEYFNSVSRDQLVKDIVETGSASYFENEKGLLLEYEKIVANENLYK